MAGLPRYCESVTALRVIRCSMSSARMEFDIRIRATQFSSSWWFAEAEWENHHEVGIAQVPREAVELAIRSFSPDLTHSVLAAFGDYESGQSARCGLPI